MAEVLSTFQLEPGGDVPRFTLPDAWGNFHSFDEIAGPKGVVVVFACNHCPYVVHIADALAGLAKEFHKAGVATVAINSNDIVKYPEDAPERMSEFAAKHGWEFPYLFDEDQTVALAYGAACTPDFFVVDGIGKLAYAGQFDDTRPKSGMAAHGGDLVEAIRQMARGEAPRERPYPSSGCNIKWKENRRPDWWNAGHL